MSETHKVLAVVGMSNSGKGTITDHLEAQGFKKVYFGGMVYDEVKKRGLDIVKDCLLYTSPSPRDKRQSRMPSSA